MRAIAPEERQALGKIVRPPGEEGRLNMQSTQALDRATVPAHVVDDRAFGVMDQE